MIRSRTCVLMVVAALTLAACESSEDRAERYYQSALELLESGDEERALIELRNVFQHDGFHLEARELYAAKLLERGNIPEAYGQYLRLIEQYPDILEARLVLAEISIGQGDWVEVQRHGEAALEIAPEDVRVRALQTVMLYYEGEIEDLEDVKVQAVADARAILEEAPDNLMARRIVIDAEVNSRTPTAALDDLDIALELDPTAIALHYAKFEILNEAERKDDAQLTLQTMYRQFPDVEWVRTTLAQWYLFHDDLDALEQLYRDVAGDRTGEPENHVTVVEFLRRFRGEEVAIAELDELIAANADTPNAELFEAMKAAMRFQPGDPNGSIDMLRQIIAEAEATDQTRRLKIILTRLLLSEGNEVGARALVEEVLAEDATQVEALKLRADWLINDDRPDAAITDLRTALDQAPEDPQVLVLMARAQERAGNSALAGERLALAVEVSNQGINESLLYAEFLLRQRQVEVAKNVLIAAREAHPGDLNLMFVLADIWMSERDWDSLESLQVVLRQMNTEDSLRLADRIEATKLLNQDQLDAGLALLQDQLAGGDDPIAAAVLLIQTQINTRKYGEARQYLDELLAENPDIQELRVLDANLLVGEGKLEDAEALLRDIIADGATSDVPARSLFALLRALGRPDEAREVLEAALIEMPEAGNLMFIKAGLIEQEGDIEGALEIYEALYNANRNNSVLANNLASLLSVYDESAEGLERAYSVARRLRGSDVPAFQDTYGWIEYRRGNYTEAVTSLEPAAEGLPDDPVVQAHLGLTYVALERFEEARVVLERAIELAEGREHVQLDRAREALEALPDPE